MSTYLKPYAKNEFNFEIELVNAAATNDFVLNVLDNDVEFEIWGCEHSKTDGTGTEVQVQVDVEQLTVKPTGGVDAVVNVDYLRANRNLQRGDVLITSVELLKDDGIVPFVIDRTNYLNIFRCGGIATKAAVAYASSGDTLFKYSLKRNTSYLIRSTILVGATGTSKSFVFGILRDL